MAVIIIALATFVSTMVGGLLALRFRDKLHLILGFSAGAVIAVALFDLIPESISLGSQFFGVKTVTSLTALGFLAYLILDRSIFLHTHGGEHGGHEEDHSHGKKRRSILGAGSLSIHSFLDGLAVGLAFQVSTAIGAIVAVAVLVHDFSDGINTVGIILKGEGSRKQAMKWLLVDSIAPVIGAGSTLFFSLNEMSLAVILSLFAGFFLYIGASELVPESYHAHPKFLTTIMTILGAAVLYAAISIARL